MSHIFISYSKQDRDYARQLADHLLALGFDVWIDDHIDVGEEWENSIFKAIDECSAFIVIMTPRSHTSKWVRRECNYADDQRHKPQFPILLEGEVFPRYTINQYDDARDKSLPDGEFYERLAQYSPPKADPGKDISKEFRVADHAPLPESSAAERNNALDANVNDSAPPDKPGKTGNRRNVIIGGFGLVALLILALLIAVFVRNSNAEMANSATVDPLVGCVGSPPPRVSVGTHARVERSQVIVRSEPLTAASQVGLLTENELLQIIGGPVCDAAQNRTWWQVSAARGFDGWLIEGRENSYYIEPIAG